MFKIVWSMMIVFTGMGLLFNSSSVRWTTLHVPASAPTNSSSALVHSVHTAHKETVKKSPKNFQKHLLHFLENDARQLSPRWTLATRRRHQSILFMGCGCFLLKSLFKITEKRNDILWIGNDHPPPFGSFPKIHWIWSRRSSIMGNTRQVLADGNLQFWID